MIEHIIAFCLQQRLMVIGATLAIAVSGIIAFENLPVQAFPDVQNVFVQVVTQYPGQAPEEVEKLVSLPIERVMNGLPHLINMRSVSIFGLSVVTLTFDDNAEDYFSRQQVLERLRYADIPQDVDPKLGPLSTGVGEILRFVIDAKHLPLIEQRALEDWVIEPKIRSVQGVADVVNFGGGIKEYKVSAKPDADVLRWGVSLQAGDDGWMPDDVFIARIGIADDLPAGMEIGPRQQSDERAIQVNIGQMEHLWPASAHQ